MFNAKVPPMYMYMSMIMTINDKNARNDLEISQPKDLNVHLKEDLRVWLETNCIGEWRINFNKHELEFDNEADYVNYSLIWN